MQQKNELMQKIDVDEDAICRAVDDLLYDSETIHIYIRQILQGRETYVAHNDDGNDRIKLDGGNLQNMLKENLGMIETSVRIIRDILELEEEA